MDKPDILSSHFGVKATHEHVMEVEGVIELAYLIKAGYHLRALHVYG